MAFIFMDESGDLGFDFSKQKTSRFFLVTFLLVPREEEAKKVRKIIKKIFAGFTPQELRHHRGFIHSFQEKPATRRRLLAALAKQSVSVLCIVLNKEHVYTKLKDEKIVLYNYVTNILLDRLLRRRLVPLADTMHLVAAKRETNVFLNQNFREYLRQQASHNHRMDLDITIHTPAQEKCLQVTDCVSWALFRKYEHGDPSYADIIRGIIAEEAPLFP